MSNQTEVMMLRKTVAERLMARMKAADVEYEWPDYRSNEHDLAAMLDPQEWLDDELRNLRIIGKSCSSEQSKLELLLLVMDVTDRYWDRMC